MLLKRILSKLPTISYTKSVFLRSSCVSTQLFCDYSTNAPMGKPLRSKKPKSNNAMVQYFVDKHKVRTIGGKGGDGMISYLSVYAKEFAGPDGGDGGNGGHVLLKATSDVKELNHCSSVIEGKNGEKGMRKNCHGKNSPHSVVNVPIGTIIKNEQGKIIADLNAEGTIFIAARGGAGGRGNAFFTTDVEQTPDIAEYGADGEQIIYYLEVRSMAHVGLLGFPNAGKSTLLRAISRARPKVAPYPFTTLHPHIGMVLYDDFEQIAVADLPGLITGSHKNNGLGIQFLQHVERCLCLIYIVDVSIEKPWVQVKTLQNELAQFNEDLLNRPKLLVANKIDMPDTMENVRKLQERCKDFEIIPISARNGTNLLELLNRIRVIYDENSINDNEEQNNP